jgi:hypothetical protein
VRGACTWVPCAGFYLTFDHCYFDRVEIIVDTYNQHREYIPATTYWRAYDSRDCSLGIVHKAFSSLDSFIRYAILITCHDVYHSCVADIATLLSTILS